MAFTQTDLDALDAARKQGARRVRFQDREFEFDSVDDYLKLRKSDLNDIAQQSGPQQVRQVRVYTTNGWGTSGSARASGRRRARFGQSVRCSVPEGNTGSPRKDLVLRWHGSVVWGCWMIYRPLGPLIGRRASCLAWNVDLRGAQ